MDRFSRQNQAALNDTLDQMDLIDIFRALHPKAAEYTYFSSAHGMFSRKDHMFGHKTSLNKFKKIEIISRVFSDHTADADLVPQDLLLRFQYSNTHTHGL